MGLSTLTAGYVLWTMIHQPNTKALVIATKQDTAANLINTVKFMYGSLPKWLGGEAINNNALSLKLKNGSFIKASSASSDAGRSESLSFLIFDEAAFINDIDRIWASAQQTIATGGRALVISTPNGQGNWYHKLWVASESESDQAAGVKFNPIRLDWWLHPDRNEEWLKQQQRLINDPRIVAQEILCSFLASGHTVIDPDTIEFIKENHIKEPIQKIGVDSNTWIWEHPYNGSSYMVVADVARGDGADYSTFHILNLDTMKQVAEYRGLIDTKEFAKWLVSMSTHYNNALLVVENNNIGYSTLQSILDLGYKNIFWSYKNVDYVDEETQLPKNYDTEDKSKMVPGFTTTSRNRPLMIEKLQDYLRDNSLIVRSKRLINELDTFVWINGRAQAQRSYNDDLVMAIAIGCWVRDTAIRLRNEGLNVTRKNLSQYGKVVYNPSNRENPYNHNIGGGISLDLREFL